MVVAHTFVTGGAASDSERDLSIGNVDDVPISVFAGFDYVALGHLHGPQAFDGERVGYSGSPLPYFGCSSVRSWCLGESVWERCGGLRPLSDGPSIFPPRRLSRKIMPCPL